MRRHLLPLLLCSAALALPLSATRLHVADVTQTVRLTDPEISPDGRWVAVVAGRPNLDEDRTDDELLLVDVAAHRTRVLTRREHAGFPRWSPDGKTLAYLAADEKKSLQIWLLSTEVGGESTQLTHSPTSIEQLAWRPDGKAIAFVREETAVAGTAAKGGSAGASTAGVTGVADAVSGSLSGPAHCTVGTKRYPQRGSV